MSARPSSWKAPVTIRAAITASAPATKGPAPAASQATPPATAPTPPPTTGNQAGAQRHSDSR